MNTMIMQPMFSIIQSYIDNSSPIQIFGAFPTVEMANEEISVLTNLMQPAEYRWVVVPIWDVSNAT